MKLDRLKITLDINKQQNGMSKIDGDTVLAAQISVNGEWMKEIGGFQKVSEVFEILSDNKDFAHIINTELHEETYNQTLISCQSNFFTNKLTSKEQAYILDKLFGFRMIDNIIYDDQEEFYGMNKNNFWDLDTLKGIFEYHEHVSHIKGKNELRNLLSELSQLE